MTDISTPPHALSRPAAPANVLRLAANRLKHLFNTCRGRTLDTCHGNAHLLKDVGIRRSHDARPTPAIDRLW